jgi:hypothetical protein
MAAKKKPSGGSADHEIGVYCKTAGRLSWRDIKPLQGKYKTRTAADIGLVR